uniref:phenylalanine--tRNA ligase n=1 Tax=Apophlaea sinclairii TaxID=212746 RepID=A0A1C9CBR8_9FLOR|nr:phenylalanyl-tRNA synthetase beta chain [Apophlaea sinclairii]AOM65838.1 phenylalanyl-tRNA synthetase beta chain [Apophlaea sinclairii]
MKILWKLLSQVLDLSFIHPNQLIRLLTSIGCEVESVKNLKSLYVDDVVLDIVPTPNRQDLFNIIGISREVAITLQQKLDFKFCNKVFLQNISKRNEIICSNSLNNFAFVILLINGIQVKKSPQWIMDCLLQANIKPINNVRDIQNYIKLKWGQKLEVLDISQFYLPHKQNTIMFKSCLQSFNSISSNQNFSVTVNNHSIIKANCEDFNTFTHSVIIKSKILRNTSKTNSISCEDNILYHAIEESIFLYSKFCNGSIQDYQIKNPLQAFGKQVKVIKKNLIRTLGPVIGTQQLPKVFETQIVNILSLLNLEPMVYSNYWVVTIPEYRSSDLLREIDIIEEVGRVYGYNHFYDCIPRTYMKRLSSRREYLKRHIRYFLRNVGFHELVHSSLQKKQGISIHNPLSDEYSGLRSDLATKLIQSLYYNAYQSSDPLHGFEIGKIFYQKQSIIYEKMHLGIVVGYKKYLRSSWLNKPNSVSWFQAKGIILNLCNSLGVNLVWKKAEESLDTSLRQLLHIKRTATLYFQQKKVGFFGEASPKLCYHLSIKGVFYICELDLEAILEKLQSRFLFYFYIQSYSIYPSITRDISIIVPKELAVSNILEEVKNVQNAFVKSIELLHEYIGYPIPKSKRNLSFRIKYQSVCKTLTKIQTNRLDNYIKHLICSKIDVEIRI